MSKLAKAIYDNTADSVDELAFRKGDIVTVTEQQVAGSSGWWMCSLYGRHGLAPANRLRLLSQTGPSESQLVEKPNRTPTKPVDGLQNIYQIPCVHRSNSCSGYQQRGVVYTVPSIPSSAANSPSSSAPQPEGMEGKQPEPATSDPWPEGPTGELYDVPSLGRRASLFTESTIPKWTTRKHSLIPLSELEKNYNITEKPRRYRPEEPCVYSVPPPPLVQDPNYDIPVPSASGSQEKTMDGYRTLPNPRKPEWIYDVPLGPDKPGPSPSFNNARHSKDDCATLYDTLPTHVLPVKKNIPSSSLYDIPKPNSPETQSTNPVLQRAPVPAKPSSQTPTSKSECVVPPNDDPTTEDVQTNHKPLEYRDFTDTYTLKRLRSRQARMLSASTAFHGPSGISKCLGQEEERGKICNPSKVESRRISTASSSSTSSCDSLALSSSSPEPMREVTLSQEETCRRLLQLQNSITKAVPRLMEYVSSNWRCKEHLEKNLKAIKESAEEIARSLTCFLQFALDVKGNARRLTDGNLQARLYKQLTAVENSGVILQQTVVDLNVMGWPLHALCQDPSQAQTPDQLERFVMVARTVPEEVKRLVSIINANARLLFRTPQKDPDSMGSASLAETNKCHNEKSKKEELVEDSNDYVVLQAGNRSCSVDSGGSEEEEKSGRACQSEHCRLYFGALQKAILGFVNSLQGDQPPEKFISQSKLVIMVGQRLVETLCRQAQRGGSSQSVLYRSSHLCALLKQLAVSTKKAALHFPDQQALHEAVKFAKELSQKAQHFRLSMDPQA